MTRNTKLGIAVWLAWFGLAIFAPPADAANCEPDATDCEHPPMIEAAQECSTGIRWWVSSATPGTIELDGEPVATIAGNGLTDADLETGVLAFNPTDDVTLRLVADDATIEYRLLDSDSCDDDLPTGPSQTRISAQWRSSPEAPIEYDVARLYSGRVQVS